MDKEKSFLNIMVKTVFLATFVFTVFMIFIAWSLNWENMATTLVERWFTIMVGELIVMGGIQIAKEFTQSQLRITEMKIMQEMNNNEEEQKYDR